MNISEIMTEKNIFVGIKAGSKRELLQEMSANIAALTKLDERTVFDTLLERENLGSTGFGGGTALPHGRFAGLDKVHAFLCRTASPIAFEAIDDKPVDLIVFLLSPEDSGADHLTALAKISRVLKDETTCAKIRQMSSAIEIYALLNNLD